MKILLVRPKFSSIVASLEPLGLEYVAAMLRKIGAEPEIMDEFLHSWLFRFSRLAKKVKSGNYDVIGFNANANTVDYILNTARKLKVLFPGLKVMVGGPEAELNYKDFCKEQIDYVYYDNSLLSLEHIVQSGFDPDVMQLETGIAFKKDGRWLLRDKGPPAQSFTTAPDRRELYRNLKKNFIFCKSSFAILKASWSCPFDCSFCYCTKMNSGVYTERPVNDIIEEIKNINHPRIWFVDDTFLLNRERVTQFCKRIIEEGINKQFMAYSRADFIAENPDVLPLLYQAGFRDLLVGLEAVADDLLEEYNKKTTLEQNELAVRYMREAGIVCNALFVVSHQFRHRDFRAVYQFIKRNRLLWVVIGIFTPYKGTDAYEQYKGRLIRYHARRLDGLHITIKPEHMTSFMFMLRTYWLYVLTYPKVIFRTCTKTAYNTKKHGWL